MSSIRSFKEQLAKATGDVSAPHWLTTVARVGYAARGVVFLLIGGLAVLAAVGQGGQTGDSKDALQTTLSAPGGWALLTVLSIGLLAFAAWRAFQAVVDPDHAEHDFKSIGRRIGFAISGIVYALLAFAAVKIAWGHGSGGDSESNTDSNTAWLMSQPFGRGLVGLLGAIIIGVGVGMVVNAWKCKFARKLSLTSDLARKLRPVCRFGIAARGLVFMVIGALLIYAAYEIDPSKAGGMAQVFREARSQSHGQILLGVMAAGLFSFGVYGIVQSIYRRLGVTKTDR